MVVIISPRTARRYLRDIHDTGRQFRTVDGKSLKNLVELACYLKECEDPHFKHHVSHVHNHFSNWVDHTILDKDLARQMSLVVEKNPTKIIVFKRINFLVHHATRTPYGREKAKMILEDVQLPEEVLLTNDGREIRNLWELKEFLEKSSDHTYSYHANHPLKNDFHEWVAEIIMDFELADRLMAANNREESARHVAERISQLEAHKAHKPRGHDLCRHIEQYVEVWPWKLEDIIFKLSVPSEELFALFWVTHLASLMPHVG
jgi:hypothetical protein